MMSQPIPTKFATEYPRPVGEANAWCGLPEPIHKWQVFRILEPVGSPSTRIFDTLEVVLRFYGGKIEFLQSKPEVFQWNTN